MNILVIGESCSDVYHYGLCDRVCPEAPVLCFKNNGETLCVPGMAANVKKNIESISNFDVKLLTNDSDIIKRRYVDTKFNRIVFRSDENDICEKINEALLWSHYKVCYDAIVISDYCKGFLSKSVILKITNSFRCPVFMDTKKSLGDWSQNVDFIKINEHEYELNRNYNHKKNMIVTLGKNGAEWISPHGVYKFPTSSNEVVDTCGAGDTFISALVVEYLNGGSIPDSINFANKCCGEVIKKMGVVTP